MPVKEVSLKSKNHFAPYAEIVKVLITDHRFVLDCKR